jgi:hypothetical protein
MIFSKKTQIVIAQHCKQLEAMQVNALNLKLQVRIHDTILYIFILFVLFM